MEKISRFLGHDAGPIAQFVKYAVAGAIATGVNVAVLVLVGWRLIPSFAADDRIVVLARRHLGIEAAAAPADGRAFNAAVCAVIAFFISNAVCYLLNRLFVFRPGRHAPIVEALLFMGVSALSILVGTICQTILISRFGIDTSLAMGANIVSSLAINFVMRKFVVFRG